MEYPSIDTITNAIRDISGSSHILAVDATALAIEHFGNALHANMVILGLALATNSIPLKIETIKTAINELLAQPEENLKAVEIGLQTGKIMLKTR
jgi:Pyruvate/2-oxoacid:ferredoxin oxidoreductase gamma subunit